MNTPTMLAAIAVLGSMVAGTATAHHSPAAFDLDKEVIIEGTLTKFLLANPHTYLTVETVGADGKRVSQDIEAGPISTMQPIGLTRDSLRVGEHVIVRASPSRRGAGHTVLGLDATRADGRVFPLFALSASVRPASAALATSIEGVWLPTQDGFSTLWAAVETWPLTNTGRQALAEARRVNATTHSDCVPGGAPMLMVFLVATTVTVDAHRIVFEIDWLDAQRVVHLDLDAHPPNLEPTLQGHSIGHWDSDVLVVDTIGFTPHAEGIGFGMPSSDRKHLVERFALSTDRRHLDYDVVVEDPLYLTEPARHRSEWAYSPGLPASGVKCDLEIARRYLREGG
jgi:hypothetical protein